jgi:hypothetical protein
LIVAEDRQGGELAREALLVVQGFVFAHFEEDSSSIGGNTLISWKVDADDKLSAHQGSQANSPEFKSSVSGAVAPSCSINSATSLSTASSHKTPAATRFGSRRRNKSFKTVFESNSTCETHLNVFNVIVEQQLNEHWNNILLADHLTVVLVFRENVKGANGSLDDFLHSNAIGVGSWLL